jgi:hypothetical protein
MLDRQSELDAIKKVDLSTIAASLAGFVVEKKRTTKKTVMMSNGADKIAISYNGRHYVFWTVGDNHRSGTAIDFVQHYVERGCSVGRVRQLLRPFLSSNYLADVRQQFSGKYALEIKENKVDLETVLRRYEKFTPIAQHHSYLCDARGIPLKLLQSERVFGRVRQDRRGVVAFPHWGCPEGNASEKRVLTGYELKSASISLFSSGGRKGLWSSAGMKGDHTIVVAESGIDALSYLALHGEQGLRVVSIAGNMNGQQPQLIRSAIERLGEGKVVAAFDNDQGGDKLTEQLSEMTRAIGRNSLIFEEKRPATRGQDWNHVLLGTKINSSQLKAMTLATGR